jgi:hypothetical protein
MEPIEILNGVFSIIFVMISLIVGITIIIKYFQYKQRTLLYFGITWIGITSPWLPSTISFLKALFTGTGLTPAIYFLIGNIAAPIILVIWIVAFTDLKYKDKRKILLIIYVIIGVAFETYFIYFLISDPNVIGDLTGILDVRYKSITLVFAVFVVLNVLIPGILIARESLKSDDREINLKGRFLLAAFISWTIGAMMDAALEPNIITLTIARLILISSALEFYTGFLLPEKVKNIFLK